MGHPQGSRTPTKVTIVRLQQGFATREMGFIDQFALPRLRPKLRQAGVVVVRALPASRAARLRRAFGTPSNLA